MACHLRWTGDAYGHERHVYVEEPGEALYMAAIVIWILFLEYLSHCPSLCRQVPMLVNQNKNLYEFIILEFFLKRIFHLADVSLAIFKPSPWNPTGWSWKASVLEQICGAIRRIRLGRACKLWLAVPFCATPRAVRPLNLGQIPPKWK